ncbi:MULTISPECIES: LacI family DNA-binding transcriptional regulator [Streptomyces]|uniref:Putative DeoR-family transcriptional regulator n=1 Tax=Streptomyces himastatinicus ATCC 53653 TaxID=457427 RepID=D9WDV1_9ACTN|nr:MULTISPECIES: LacI family DNA-binding transcriptional regulator [Streptomyces]EFL21011.1 putative DeoR-family transcriptional regulator [Streptomyces himastatinicus ATCC 53653]
MRESARKRQARITDLVESRGIARITDLADELGVSVVTVRRDVEELARRGEVRRGHGVARSLQPMAAESTATGDTVGMVIPERNTYLTEAVQAAREVAEKAGLRLALHIAADEPDAERTAVRSALEAGARGLVLSPHWRTAAEAARDHSWLRALDVPVVLMERRPERGSSLYELDCVRSDHAYGVHLALGHLTSLGHRRIVLAARDDSPTARVIRSEFAEQTAARGIAEGCPTILSSRTAGPDPRADDARAADLADTLRRAGATAALIHGDMEALVLVQRLREAGVEVPRDCSVVAYNDVVADMGQIALTAVAPPKAEVGRAALGLLIRQLDHAREGRWPGAARHLELLPGLVARDSTVPLA